jgi:hypothetical protein
VLTIFAIPKPFANATRTLQDNAIGSWRRLGADCELILFGDDPGVAEASARHGATHVPQIRRTPSGTPILSDAFERAAEMARHPLLCFVNADIILLDDFLDAVRFVAAARRKFLLISSRFNCFIDAPLEFRDGWHASLRDQARAEGRMYPAGGSDVFVFPRGLYPSLPPFAVGRGYWDNWLMYAAARDGAALVDATAVLTAIHQDHDYDHVPHLPANSDIGSVLESAEARRNLALAGGTRRLYTAYDATEILTPEGRLVSTLHPWQIHRRFKASARRALAIAKGAWRRDG